MFDLERELRKWRRTMSARLPMRRTSVRELETHLRDAVLADVQAGKTEEVAWTEAVARLGAPDVVAAEFAKLPAPPLREWLPAKVVLGLFAAFVAVMSFFILRPILNGNAGALLGLHVLAVTVGYASLLSGGAIASWSTISRSLLGWSPIESELLRTALRRVFKFGLALTAVGVVLGGVWSRRHLGSAWNWDPREIGGLAVLIWYVAALALLGQARDERLMLILGQWSAAVAVLGWLGPVFVPAGGLHDYSGTRGTMPLGIGAMILLQVMLLAPLFLRPGRLRFRFAE